MKKVVKISFSVLFLLGGVYLLFPLPAFPQKPDGALESNEPADTESPFRKAYFTNLTREEIMEHYDGQFSGLLSFRLDQRREDAYAVIRDQTPSSYLEEIIQPGKGSLYINVYVPDKPTDQINRNGIHYLNKVTIHYIPSQLVGLLTVWLLVAGMGYLMLKEYAQV